MSNEKTLPVLLRAPLVTIGSHGDTHLNFCRLTPLQIRDQLLHSKKVLEQFSSPISSLAFPYGEFNDDTLTLAREAGYRYLFSGGDVKDKYEKEVVPRIGVATWPGIGYTILSI